VPPILKLLGAALLVSCLHGTAGAQTIDPMADRLPRFYADACGAGGEGRGNAAFFAPGSRNELAGVSEQGLNHDLEGVQRDGGWVLLTGHLDAAEAGEAGRLDLGRAEFVRDWLIARGLRPDRIWLRSLGNHGPIEVTNGASARNRRVDFLLTYHGAACRRSFHRGVDAWF